MNKILFIGHNASRTGAPILLRDFLNYLRIERPGLQSDILLRETGVLREDFENIGNVYLFKPGIFERKKTIASTLFFKFKIRDLLYFFYLKILLIKLRRNNYNLIYSNTVVNVDVLKFLKSYDTNKITHVRELNSTINFFGGNQLMESLKYLSSYFIADSYAVKNNLVQEYGFLAEKIKVIHEFIPIVDTVQLKKDRNSIKTLLGIPIDSIVVGASGSGIWRKGPDLFIQVIVQLIGMLDADLYFIWTGFFTKTELDKIKYDLKKLCLEERVFFPGSVPNPFDYYSIFDVFLLTSREEPFGIVALEVSLFETPTVCFEKVGGLPEYIENDAGLVVPYLNTYSMAKATAKLIRDDVLREKLGKRAKSKTIEKYNLKVASEAIISVLENHIS